mgnify:FL=1
MEGGLGPARGRFRAGARVRVRLVVLRHVVLAIEAGVALGPGTEEPEEAEAGEISPKVSKRKTPKRPHFFSSLWIRLCLQTGKERRQSKVLLQAL